MPRKPGIYRKIKTMKLKVSCYNNIDDDVYINDIIIPYNECNDERLLLEIKQYFSKNIIPLKIINKETRVNTYRMDYITFIRTATKLD